MAKQSEQLPLAGLQLDPNGDVPMYQQLYQYLREAILIGRLRPGQRLPATRHLAGELGVSRNTVMLAFDDLFSEGYLKGKTGSGTFVTDTLPDQLLYASPPEQSQAPPQDHNGCFSRRGTIMTEIPINCMTGPEDILPFQHGLPGLFEFPYDIWSRLANRQLRSMDPSSLGYYTAAGYMPLRRAIAEYLRTFRAVRCEAEQVIIVNGTQQALNLIARLLLDKGDKAWVEDPGYVGTHRALVGAGIDILPIPVNDEGLDVRYGRTLDQPAKMAYVTPSHQFPLGVTMSVCRRLDLLEWANDNESWIVEDDYDSEYRYCGRPLSSLQGLDNNHRVIYLGTFSKVLFPALRIGYMVVPPHLVDGFVAAKTIVDRQHPTFEQMVLTEFINEGHFGRHIRRMRTLYQERHDMLINTIGRHLQDRLTIYPADAGMHVIGWLNKSVDDAALAVRARQHGVAVSPLSEYALQAQVAPGLIMGYAAFNEKQISQAVEQLARLL